FFNYALMIRQDYDITSSLRRGALQKSSKINNGAANKESTDRGPIQIMTKNSFSALSEETDTNLKDKECVNADDQTPVKSQFVNDSDEDVDEGMNLSPKQNEVRQVIYDNKLSVCAILESHVATRNLERVCKHVFKNWNWISNVMSCLKGTHIIIGWNQNDVDVAVIHQDPQVIHTRIWIKADRKEFICSFVYAFNKYIHRRPLWNGLCLHKNYINNRPWCLLGDFNAPLYVGDTSMGSSSLDVTMREFKECVKNMEVMDVQSMGLQYTWNQKPKGKDGILYKLDRVLANLEFLDVFMSAHAVFKPYKISNHSPAVLSIPSLVKVKPMPFKFFNVIILDDRIDVVTDAYGNVHHSTEVAKAFINHSEIFLWQPGPDGFTAAFFKDTWDMIGVDVIKAVKEFFTNGRLLKELNHTIIALIPKVNTPARVTDYRPISCCNVLFKCISKIIANRLKGSLKRLVSPNQSAFVPGRCISDNILLTQEIMHNYHLDRGVPRCAFKVYIQKAYDTVDWDFL
nr:RNA-directed DNA polymerase, eukaryota, reverse transcriptase zinc-binding domain protein [Tanacetum cinerariifolium]